MSDTLKSKQLECHILMRISEAQRGLNSNCLSVEGPFRLTQKEEQKGEHFPYSN